MIEIAKDVYLIPGKNKSRFPYCACLYIKGRDLRVLIDAGMGEEHIAPAIKAGIDVLVLSHCHIDHRLTRRLIPDIPVWCHEKEEVYLQDRNLFFAAMGLKRSGLDLDRLFDFAKGSFEIEIAHRLIDGNRIDLGGITLQTIHTPGHTPGHLAFSIPERNLLFAGDIDLTSFGPFYGHDFADISDFLTSIEGLKRVNADTVISSHAGPFNSNLVQRFDDYAKIVQTRDRLLLESLNQPKPVKEFEGSNLFYKSYPDFPDLIRWFELVHIEKHLARLKTMGKVRHDGNRWARVS